MFDVSFWELILVFVLALLVLGPERLPRVAHTAGLWLGRARNAMRRLQRDMQREFLIEETRQAAEKNRSAADEKPAANDTESKVTPADPSSGDR